MDPVMQSARKHLVKIYVRSLLCQHFKNQISNTGESPEWRSFSVILQATFFCLQDGKTERLVSVLVALMKVLLNLIKRHYFIIRLFLYKRTKDFWDVIFFF